MKLAGKYAIVTGASTDIGRAIAVALAREGASVAITARTKTRLKETQRIIERGNGRARVFVADLSDLNSINNLIDDIKSDTKQVDIIVNAAGVWHDKGEVYASNTFESFTQIEDLTIGFSEELADRKIQVNCISPSDTGTESYNKFYPRHDEVTMTPEEVAQYATYLCSAEANSITGKVYVMIAGKKPYEAFHT